MNAALIAGLVLATLYVVLLAVAIRRDERRYRERRARERFVAGRRRIEQAERFRLFVED